MTLTLSAPMRSLLASDTHRLAKLWQIKRRDGVFMRFTSWDENIDFGGFTYTPTGGGSLSAKRRQSGLTENEADFVGVLTSPAITFTDLWSGRYREAEVTEYLVDGKFPWLVGKGLGYFSKTKYWIASTTFDGETWTAHLSSFPIWMQTKIGRIYGRTCDRTLYDAKCTVNPALFAAAVESMQVDNVLTPRLKFELLLIDNPQSNDYYNDGHLLWISGANVGLVSQVKDYVNSPTPRTVELHLQTPNPIVDGDLFNMWRGCDKLRPTCIGVFNNIANSGDHSDIPGSDQLYA